MTAITRAVVDGGAALLFAFGGWLCWKGTVSRALNPDRVTAGLLDPAQLPTFDD